MNRSPEEMEVSRDIAITRTLRFSHKPQLALSVAVRSGTVDRRVWTHMDLTFCADTRQLAAVSSGCSESVFRIDEALGRGDIASARHHAYALHWHIEQTELAMASAKQLVESLARMGATMETEQ